MHAVPAAAHLAAFGCTAVLLLRAPDARAQTLPPDARPQAPPQTFPQPATQQQAPSASAQQPYGYGYPGSYPAPYPPPQGAPAPYGYPYAYPYPYPYPYPYAYPPPYAAPYPVVMPETLSYEEGNPIPRGYHVESRSRRGLAIAGGALFLGAWGISLLTAGTLVSDSSNSGAGPLFIPVVGPFITMGTSHLQWSHSGDQELLYLLAFDGVAQTIGAAMFVVGLASSTQVLVLDRPRAASVPKLAIGVGRASASWQF